MTGEILVFPTVPTGLIELLTSRLPTSLTILRRLQYTLFPSGTSPTARILFVSDTGSIGGQDGQDQPHAFTVSYLDLGGGPDTQMFIYSTIENDGVNDVPEGEYDRQLESLIQMVVRLRSDHGKELVYKDSVLLGSLHSKVRRQLEGLGRIQPRKTGEYDKWLFRREDLPSSEEALPEGMHWDKATFRDCEIVISKTDILAQRMETTS